MRMTDDEIINALDCCTLQMNGRCANCYLIGNDRWACADILNKNALMLIKRQQAEIENLKTIDVQEEKHGKWKATKVSERDYDGSYSNYTEYTCSECKQDNGMTQTNYCPNCGAKMDGKDGGGSMSELKDQTKAKKFIDAERLEHHFEYCIDEAKNTNGVSEDFEIALKATKNQPAADVVAVVRCKNCEYRRTKDCAMQYECFNCWAKYSWESDDDYCSYGKKKEL